MRTALRYLGYAALIAVFLAWLAFCWLVLWPGFISEMGGG